MQTLMYVVYILHHMIKEVMDAGLSRAQAEIYLAVIEKPSTAAEIQQATGLDRRYTYDMIVKLLEMGLLGSALVGKKRVYSAGTPAKLLSRLAQEKESLRARELNLKKILPILEEVSARNEPLVQANTYKGNEGLKTVWEDMLHAQQILWIGARRYVPEQMPYFFTTWNRKRNEKTITMKTLLRADVPKRFAIAYENDEVKFLSEDFSGNPLVIVIFGTKVAQILYGPSPVATVTESKAIADNYKKYFEYLWKNARKVR